MSSTRKDFFLVINRELCKKCGICVAFCPKNVFSSDQDGSPVISNPDQCIECKMCILRCPDFAISWEEAETK